MSPRPGGDGELIEKAGWVLLSRITVLGTYAAKFLTIKWFIPTNLACSASLCTNALANSLVPGLFFWELDYLTYR